MGETAATPMMAQYLEIKGRHPEGLLFYRMGDFYELFFEDAVTAAAALDIALTRRGSHGGDAVPMCGVPVASAEGYLQSLIRQGFTVAVAEQLEAPGTRPGKVPLRRDVVRVVTPGTLTEEALLEARRANWLAAWARGSGDGGLAWADISTGAFGVMPLPPGRLAEELARIGPRELLAAEDDREALALAEGQGARATGLGRAAFGGQAARRVAEWFGVAGLDAWGPFTAPEAAAMAALLGYLELTQRGARPRLLPPRREAGDGAVALDAATRASLEIARAQGGGRAGSLLDTVDRTATAAGGRLLEARLGAPSRVLGEIEARLDAVAWLVAHPEPRAALRQALGGAADLDRALARLALDRGGPRDLGLLRDGLRAADRAGALLAGVAPPARLAAALGELGAAAALGMLLGAALAEQPPPSLRDGGFVRPGYEPELDAARGFRDQGREVIAGLEASYRARTGIGSLRIRHNAQLGYVVETTATHAGRMLSPPLNAEFLHRQTTANLLRFATIELRETEARLARAADEVATIERRVFAELSGQALAASEAVGRVAAALAEIDVAAALAEIAAAEGWTRPRLFADRRFRVEGGRHPVVEAALRRQGKPYVANACDLTERRLLLLTGPNMGGKSTYLRQNALIAILAQAGSFVPADAAEIGLVSRIFSRVGAADDIGRGRSTFMVEMVETAAILHGADDRALVILDEVGRGTATWDGLAIAWAVLEHLHDANRCRALFATHFHELADLAARLPEAANAHVAAADWEGEVVFLHELRPGAADRSYGVQVARLAGLPEPVLRRARSVLRTLEKGERSALVEDLPLFAREAAAPVPSAPVPSAPVTSIVETRLRDVRPDELSPREALDLVYELRSLLP